MKFKRLMINGLLAATFGVSAVAMESGALSSLATIAFAATTTPSSVFPVSQLNTSGSTGSVSGTYVWTTDVTFGILVNKVDSNGKITQVTVATNNGNSATINFTGTTAQALFNSGLSMAFSSSGTNKVNDKYSFTASAQNKCEGNKSKCK